MIDLIPLSYLTEACKLSQNIDEKDFHIHLEIAQDNLSDLLGGEFYEQIESQYNTDTLSTDNDRLYEGYIKKYLAWQTYFNFMGFGNSSSTPTGFREFIDENSTVLSDVKMFALERNVLGKVNFYKGRMLSFLKLEQDKDSTKYPLYQQKCGEVFSFGITSVDKKSDALFMVNKSIINNE